MEIWIEEIILKIGKLFFHTVLNVAHLLRQKKIGKFWREKVAFIGQGRRFQPNNNMRIIQKT